MKRELLRARLDALDTPYTIVECDPALADTAAFCAHYGYSLEDSANTIVVIGKSKPDPCYAACVVLASTRLDVNKTVRKQLKVKRASFAPAEVTRDLTGMEIGGVTVVGLPADLPLLVDSRVMARERIILGGGGRDCKILAPPALLERLPNFTLVEALAKDV